MRTTTCSTLAAIGSAALLTLTIGAAPAAAQQPASSSPDGTGFYLGLLTSTQTREIGVDVNLGTAAEWERGFGVSGMFGYRTPVGLRFEFEYSMLDNNNVGFYFPPYPNGPREESSGHVTLDSLMLNAYYDIPLGGLSSGFSRVSPYVGAGVGGTVSKIQGVTSKTLQSGIPGYFGPTVLDTASRYTNTWNTRIGANVRVTDRLEVFGDWRHFKTGQLNFKTTQFPDVQVTGANIEAFEAGIHLFLR